MRRRQKETLAVPSTDAQTKPEIWSAILAASATTRPTPVCSLLVLGDHQCGKSTLLSALSHQDPSSQQHLEPLDSMTSLALQFSYTEIYDDTDAEEPAALLAMYELDDGVAGFGTSSSGSDPAGQESLTTQHPFSPLLSFALEREKLRASAVLICLDWTKPWDFVRTLEKYLGMLEREIGAMSEGWAAFRELKDELETAFREYKDAEPSMTFNSTTLDATLSAHNVTLPLGQGVLTNNLGIPIIVVCTKADAIIMLEKEKGYGDGTFDYIQQTLRTICLKYGASLLYTSTYRPPTLSTLRTHVLHTLLRSTDARAAFPRAPKPQVVQRESVCVPAGWDNWGLIRVQGAGFDCAAVAGLAGVFGDEEGGGRGVEGDAMAKAREVYEREIPRPKESKSQSKTHLDAAEDEQTFLERHLEILNSMGGGPTAATGSPFASAAASVLSTGSFSTGETFAQRLVSSSLSSSEMMEDVSAKLAKLAKLKEQTASATLRNRVPASGDVPLPTTSAGSSPKTFPLPMSAGAATSPSLGTATSAAGLSTANNEVLSNFFQSLLNKKTGGSVAAAGAGATATAPAAGAVAKSPVESPRLAKARVRMASGGMDDLPQSPSQAASEMILGAGVGVVSGVPASRASVVEDPEEEGEEGE